MLQFFYSLVFQSKEYKADSTKAFYEFFVNQGHLLHVFLISVAIALVVALVFYLAFGHPKTKNLCSPAAWWISFAVVGVLAFFVTGNSCGLVSRQSHSLRQVLEKKINEQVEYEGVLSKTEVSKYPQYQKMIDNFNKGMFHVEPVVRMAVTDCLVALFFFWVFSVALRAMIPHSNPAKGSPRYLKQ